MKSRRDVSRDNGSSPEMPEHLRIRSELMGVACKIIVDRHWTQERAAITFGVTQPRVSNHVRRKLHLFSIDGLIEMLNRAGVHVEMNVSHIARARGR
ncbi:MAG: XRE family transcriptional regulator [Gemmatimonadaceae bacterium]